MKTEQKYLSLDLELSNGHIIQVGITIGSLAQSEDQYLVRKWYVTQTEPIQPFITQLTGITDNDIRDKGQSHADIAKELSALIMQHQPFASPVTWGGGDSTELLAEFRGRNVEFLHFGRRWIDVKTWYTFLMLVKGKSASAGLRSAMKKFNLKFLGDTHRADTDAFNTLRFFFYFLKRQIELEAKLETKCNLT